MFTQLVILMALTLGQGGFASCRCAAHPCCSVFVQKCPCGCDLLGQRLPGVGPTTGIGNLKCGSPLNASLVGHYHRLADIDSEVWGDGHFAYVGHAQQNRVDIIDLTDPSKPTLAATYVVPPPDGLASTQDVQVVNGLMFIVLEFNMQNGAQIVDVRDPYHPKFLTNITLVPGNWQDIHNLFYADGFLYLATSRTRDVGIVDLRNYDPDNAPPLIDQAAWVLQGVGTKFVHDITVKNGRLYCAAWNSIEVYDVSNVATLPPRFMGSTLGYFSHSNWVTDDGKFLVSCDERIGGAAWLYELTDDGTTVNFTLRDTYTIPISESTTVHNVYIMDDLVYLSVYQAGVHVLAIDRDTKTWTLAATFDTTAEPGGVSLSGCWGVYPYLGTDKVLAADEHRGLYILDVHPNILTFSHPLAVPDLLPLNKAVPFGVRIKSIGAPVDPTSVKVHLSSGDATIEIPMVNLGSGFFSTFLPPMLDSGTGLATDSHCPYKVSFFVEAQNTNGVTFTDPPQKKPPYEAIVANQIVPIFGDNFDTDQGWTVNSQNLITGEWTRVAPIGTAAQPWFDNPGGHGTMCYVTGQGVPGGGTSDDDVDGGPTILTSPRMDFSQGAGRIRYAYWYYNEIQDDSLLVQVSDDDGAHWVNVRRYVGGAGMWKNDTFALADYVLPTDKVRIRFLVKDSPDNGVTEAAIDDVFAEVLLCH